MSNAWNWLSHEKNQKTLGFIGAALVGGVALWKAVFGSSGDVATQNPNCTMQINSTGSLYEDNGQVLGEGACMNTQGDRFLHNRSIAGKPGSE